MRLGFVEPELVVVEPGMDCITMDVHSIGSDEPYNVIKVRSPACAEQYFLIQNRQQVGFDRVLVGKGPPETHSGILIWHIDENVASGLGLLNRNWMHRAVTPIGLS